jgi:acyl transferase domain-containing protein/3-hydroxymyristoyl/3-hydroxydecanoyl-(acyl carrier protein) dehydratase
VLPSAFTLEQFWQNLVSGTDCSREVPADRWVLPANLAHHYPSALDQVASRRGCYVDPFALDPAGLELDFEQLRHLDPLYSMALQASRAAWTEASTGSLDRSRVGVILAAIALPTDGSSALTWEHYAAWLHQQSGAPGAYQPRPTSALNRMVTGLPAGIVARALGLGGGSYTLDAACASSLYALKLACDELHAGRCDAMLAGGVSRPDCLYTQMGFTALGALSPSGRCSPFDVSGDGLVVGEGAGVLTLKRLSTALEQGDHIYGLIRAIGLSNDIGGSLLAPDSEGQLRAMRSAYGAVGWSPTDVQLVECHGTGTPMGDRVEVNSLISLWKGLDWQPGQCALGSVKSMIGHLLTGAGAAGMIKVLLGMGHGVLPPSIHFTEANPQIPLPGSPFRVQTEATPWDRPGATRKAAVSAFGFGGINAHVLVEEYVPEEGKVWAVATPPRGEIAIVGLAAHLGTADDLQDWLQAQLADSSLILHESPERWNGAGQPPDGAYIDRFEMPLGGFKLPPNDIPSVLPQQSLMLQVAALAAADAGLKRGVRQERIGAVIGISLDMDTTNYQLRWCLPAALAEWQADPSQLEALRDRVSAPLNATRTLGALGSIVASRIARELQLGGPSFAVSAEECSGLKALEIAIRSLQRHEMDEAIVGAVDFAGDPRLAQDSGISRPFDPDSEGPSPGEGAIALVLKRLEDCTAADKVYAVISGLGSSHGGGIDQGVTPEAQGQAIYRALSEAGVHPAAVTLVEASGHAVPEQDLTELAVLKAWYGHGSQALALGAASSIVGQTGACSGLVSLVRAAASLHHRILFPTHGFRHPVGELGDSRIHVPHQASRWVRNRQEGARMAAVHATGRDGNCQHFLLREGPVAGELRAPQDCGLFMLGPDPRQAAKTLLAALEHHTGPLEDLARDWYRPSLQSSAPVVVVAQGRAHLKQTLSNLELFLRTPCSGQGGVFYRPEPLRTGELAFVYPGSGNHYAGMGRELALQFPQVMERLDAESDALANYLQATYTVPYRHDWPEGWAEQSTAAIAEDLHRSIMGQVTFGLVASDIVRLLGLKPQAAIGYSLGESSALVSLRAWPDRHQVFSRMEASNLFREELGGACLAARRHWGIGADQPFRWRVAVLDRPASTVEPVLASFPTTALLIVNTDQECVVGGEAGSVAALIQRLGCTAIDIEAVPTVHCKAAAEVSEEYYQLHLLTTEDPGVRYYSAHAAKSYPLNSANAAQSVLDQAVLGFNFPKLIRQAYADGVRFFVELGPGRSCSRMTERILEGKPYFARSMSTPAESEMLSLLKLLGGLIADGYAGVDLGVLYGSKPATAPAQRVVEVLPGRLLPRVDAGTWIDASPTIQEELPVYNAPVSLPVQLHAPEGLSGQILSSAQATAQAHEVYLEMAQRGLESMARAVVLQSQMMHGTSWETPEPNPWNTAPPLALWNDHNLEPIIPESRPCWLDYHQCMEFAVGSIGKVLGPDFAEIDNHPTRVRLPDDPLMLVSRIVSVEGETRSLGAGRLVTEHDVEAGAWYLDNQRMPVCVAVEAGQADLFLSAWLGIDHVTRGEQVYRLLDATVQFHRRLPTVGETIVYDIRISKFVRQGNTHLFFFEFDGTVDGQPMITMREGCAGFFEYAEIKANKGIILSAADLERVAGKVTGDYRPLVPFDRPESYSDQQVEALRAGDLPGCFGALFGGLNLQVPPTLPSGRLRLFDRILEVDPTGGRFGLGSVTAEADIHPDDWFLTCHFVDDKVMPGTLMYECCAHTLRFLLLRMGWLGEADTYTHEPLVGVPAVLRCRGPVDVTTSKVHYEVEIKEIGYNPEPYVVCDTLMHASGKAIVRFVDMSMRLVGLDREALESRWSGVVIPDTSGPLVNTTPLHNPETGVTYDDDSIVQFAEGKPSLAFGQAYLPFDSERRIARLPRAPYKFLDRVVEINQPAFVLQAGDWIEAQYDVTALAASSPSGAPSDWYFAANRQPAMCYAILLEVALQPCGWLAAYCGSALRSPEDVKFRNLGGTATLYHEVYPEAGTVRIRVRMSRVSEAGGMIVENFDMQVLQGHTLIYEGTTYFGFFSKQALANQLGVRDAKRYQPSAAELAKATRIEFPRMHPLAPEDLGYDHGAAACMPAGAMQMLDEVDVYVRDGGPAGLGLLHGIKAVNPDEWFFQAHFYQDPVWPGSLGLEAFIQLLKAALLDRYPQFADTHQFESIALNHEHTWIYRGQVLPTNKRVEVEATVSRIEDSDSPMIVADGFLVVDNLPIYEMKDFAIRLVPKTR